MVTSKGRGIDMEKKKRQALVQNQQTADTEELSTEAKTTTKSRYAKWKEQRQLKEEKRDRERYGLEPKDFKRRSNKINWKAIKRCSFFFKPYKWIFLIIGIFAILYAGLIVLKPVFVEKMITEISELNFDAGLKFGLFYTIVIICYQIVYYAWRVLANRTTNKIIKDIRSGLIQKVFQTKTQKFDLVNSGEIISRINHDTSTVAGSVDLFLSRVSDFLMAVGYVMFFFVLNFMLGVMILIAIILFTIFDNFYQRYRHKMNRKMKILSDKNIGLVSEIVRAIRDIKALNAKENIGNKYEKNITNMLTADNDLVVKSNAFVITVNIMIAVVEFAFILLGIYLLSNGLIGIGVFMVFLFYKGHALRLINSVSQMREILRGGSLCAERLMEILDEEQYPKEVFGKRKIKKPQGKIEFCNVDFAYNEKTQVLKDFSLMIPANSSMAFVGKSGHGKSTLISLIPKLYEVNAGKIKIDDIDITKLSENGLRDLVTIVPQTPYIFNTTIRENLSLVKPDMTDEEMIEACKVAQIHDFITSKPEGYDSLLGENGVILSGGQKQRIAIARALLKNSKIILLDEATSALDNESQAKIKQALDNLSGEHTLVIVAHRLTTVIDCDQIAMIEKGKIVGLGTHKELLETCESYKKLYTQEMSKKKKKQA